MEMEIRLMKVARLIVGLFAIVESQGFTKMIMIVRLLAN